MLYKFDDFVLDTNNFKLTCHGENVLVTRQAFDLLHLLIKNSHRLVTREEVVEHIWDGREVSDTTISSSIKYVRKYLGDDGAVQKYIKTVRGRGYQFICDNEIEEVAQTTQSHKNRIEVTTSFNKTMLFSLIIGCLVFVIGLLLFAETNFISNKSDDEVLSSGGSNNSITVLPFTDMSSDGTQEYFGDGVAEEILNVLAGIKELDVTSRSTAFSLKGQNYSIPEIANKLNVAYVVEGSVRSAGNRVRVTVQLIDATRDIHLWSENYDREMIDIFAIQDEIAKSIARVLEIEISDNSLDREAPTKNMDAYVLYLQGHQLFLDRGKGKSIDEEANLLKGLESLVKATDMDPNFAVAWADRASAMAVLPTFLSNDFTAKLVAPDVLRFANKAISLDPNLSQAWAVKGFTHLNQMQFQDAQIALTRSTTLNPKNETAWLWQALHYISVGYHQKALEAVNMAIKLGPERTINHGVQSTILYALGDIDKAVEVLDYNMENRNYHIGRADRIIIAAYQNDSERAFVEIEKATERLNVLDPEAYNDERKLYFSARNNPELREKAQSALIKSFEDELDSKSFFGAFMLQDGERLVHFLKYNPMNIAFFLRRIFNPSLRSVINEDVVKDYFKEIGLFAYWQDNGFPTFCRAISDVDFICE